MVMVREVINKEYIEERERESEQERERERERHVSLYFLFFGENKKILSIVCCL